MSLKLLVTGGAGFIGTNFIQYLLEHTPHHITNIDSLTYAGNSNNNEIFLVNTNYRFIKGDISNPDSLEMVFDQYYDIVIHFAAESHVDRSIVNSKKFIETNINGTHALLEQVLKGKARKMIHISTDEVYGSLKSEDSAFTEQHPILPNNPYAASKASSDLLVRSFYQTYKLPLIISRCSNNFGPFQHPEKFIPKVINQALKKEPISLYGDGLNIRDWLYVKDHCKAIFAIMNNGQDGEVYNIGGNNEKTNIEVVRAILSHLGKDEELISYVPDRKGHDRRYSINSTKIKNQLGWKPEISFEEGITQTIDWYINNTIWTQQSLSRSGSI